jgi:hypothetical protein
MYPNSVLFFSTTVNGVQERLSYKKDLQVTLQVFFLSYSPIFAVLHLFESFTAVS